MTFRGIVRDGRVELESGVSLPEGAPVDVELAGRGRRALKAYDRSKDPAFDLSRFAVRTGRKDGSAEHDHYIYGSPKRGKTAGRTKKAKAVRKSRKRP